jgi:hypothetical protein
MDKITKLLVCVKLGILATAVKLFVYYGISRREVRRLKCSNPGSESKGSQYMLSTQMQNLGREIINSKVKSRGADQLSEGNVIDVCNTPRRIYDQDQGSAKGPSMGIGRCSCKLSAMLPGRFLRPSLAPSGGAAYCMPGHMFTLIVALL